MPSVAEVIDFLKELAPLAGAESWDNVGLLLGDDHGAADAVMTCLTVTPDSAAEAISAGAGLIVTHHPIFFRPAQKLTTATVEGRMLLGLARAGVAVYSPHTAFDNAPGGINDILARRLGLIDVLPLRPARAAAQCKIVVFVPDADLSRVSDALFAAGAGQIGQYRECSFRLQGTGTFFGSEASNPSVGTKGHREEVSEWRLEVICDEARVDAAVAALRRAHSYEEPAYDVYPLRPRQGRSGAGRIGSLPTAFPFAEFAQHVQAALGAHSLQSVPIPGPVRRVAIACGAGGEFARDASNQAADVFLTGEMRFHDLLAAQSAGLGVVLPGHYASERPGVEELAARLQTQFPRSRVWASTSERDPLATR